MKITAKQLKTGVAAPKARTAFKLLNVVNLQFETFKEGTGHKPFKEKLLMHYKVAQPQAGQTLKQVQNIVLQDVNGKELDFGPEVKSPEELVLGMKATLDGRPAEGSFVWPDGTILKFKAGVLSEIINPVKQ